MCWARGGIHHVRHFLNLFFNPTPDLDYFRDLRDNFQSRYSQMQLGRSGGAGGGRGEGRGERTRERVRSCVCGGVRERERAICRDLILLKSRTNCD